MSATQGQPFSDNPNAPKITHLVYFWEKINFAGTLVNSILYGIVIALFFKCMAALFNPAYCREGRIKWGLVSYTAVMFSLATILTTRNLDLLSILYINNHEFPGVEGVLPAGPHGHEWIIEIDAFCTVPNITFALSNWLADGLLLYRCYIIYSKNPWVIAFPCLMFLGSVATGVMHVYWYSERSGNFRAGLPYFLISLLLNIFLTLMIVIQLFLHTRNVRTVMGGAGSGGLCKAIVTILIESCTLYAVSSLAFIGAWGAGSYVIIILFAILSEIQVIAPLFIIQRVANNSALTSNTVTSGRISPFKARSRGESAGGSSAVPSEDSMNSVDERGINSEPGVGVDVETANDSHRAEVH